MLGLGDVQAWGAVKDFQRYFGHRLVLGSAAEGPTNITVSFGRPDENRFAPLQYWRGVLVAVCLGGFQGGPALLRVRDGRYACFLGRKVFSSAICRFSVHREIKKETVKKGGVGGGRNFPSRNQWTENL